MRDECDRNRIDGRPLGIYRDVIIQNNAGNGGGQLRIAEPTVKGVPGFCGLREGTQRYFRARFPCEGGNRCTAVCLKSQKAVICSCNLNGLQTTMSGGTIRGGIGDFQICDKRLHRRCTADHACGGINDQFCGEILHRPDAAGIKVYRFHGDRFNGLADFTDNGRNGNRRRYSFKCPCGMEGYNACICIQCAGIPTAESPCADFPIFAAGDSHVFGIGAVNSSSGICLPGILAAIGGQHLIGGHVGAPIVRHRILDEPGRRICGNINSSYGAHLAAFNGIGIVLANTCGTGGDIVEFFCAAVGQTGQVKDLSRGSEGDFRTGQDFIRCRCRLIGIQHEVVHRAGIVTGQTDRCLGLRVSDDHRIRQIRIGCCAGLEEVNIVGNGNRQTGFVLNALDGDSHFITRGISHMGSEDNDLFQRITGHNE